MFCSFAVLQFRFYYVCWSFSLRDVLSLSPSLSTSPSCFSSVFPLAFLSLFALDSDNWCGTRPSSRARGAVLVCVRKQPARPHCGRQHPYVEQTLGSNECIVTTTLHPASYTRAHLLFSFSYTHMPRWILFLTLACIFKSLSLTLTSISCVLFLTLSSTYRREKADCHRGRRSAC